MIGDAHDVRLNTAMVLARLGVTDRHLRRMVANKGFPVPHYLGERRRWWLSEVIAWEQANATKVRPAALARGVANLTVGVGMVGAQHDRGAP